MDRHTVTGDGTHRRWTSFVLIIGQREKRSVIIPTELCTLLWKNFFFHCSSFMPNNLHSAGMDLAKEKVSYLLLSLTFVVRGVFFQPVRFEDKFGSYSNSPQSPVAKLSFIKRTTWGQQISLSLPLAVFNTKPEDYTYSRCVCLHYINPCSLA